jgi:hypothetical protein
VQHVIIALTCSTIKKILLFYLDNKLYVEVVYPIFFRRGATTPAALVRVNFPLVKNSALYTCRIVFAFSRFNVIPHLTVSGFNETGLTPTQVGQEFREFCCV